MNETLDTPTREQEERRKKPTPLLPGGSQGSSVPIGVVATILVHAILYLGTPRSFQQPYTPKENNYPEDLQLQLTPEEPPPPPMKFVEANPDAPDNKPDKTQNFAAQNQQAAQEHPTQDHNDTPQTQGKDIPSTAIVTGQKAQPMESANPGKMTPQSQQSPVNQQAQKLQQAQVPLPGFEPIKGEDADGIGTNVAKNPKNPRPVDKEVEGQEQAPENQVAVTTPPTNPGRPTPRPRPRLQNVRPAPLANQPLGVSQAGRIAVDANFSEFGDYLQELIEIVQAQWNQILSQTATYPAAGSYVTIRFTLNSKGEVSRIDEVDDHAGKQGTYACLNAIQARQPYRPWTKQMVAVLGNEQVITFGFYYW